MNIYIYGNKGFKKEIHNTLEHANIKFKLDDNSKIKDIEKLDELKQAIIDNPNDIYLIDDEKIIKKDKISQKLKFLAPKDGIEEEFLLDNGIADLSVDSLKEIPAYIVKKYEQLKLTNENDQIEESIIDIVDQAYNEDEEPFELDDELKKLLANDEPQETETTNEITENSLEVTDSNMQEEQNIEVDLDSFMDDETSKDDEKVLSKEELKDIVNFDEDVGLVNTDVDYDDENTSEESKEENSSDEGINEFENLMNELESSDDKETVDDSQDDDIESLMNEIESENEEKSEESDENDLENLMNEIESSQEESKDDKSEDSDIEELMNEIEQETNQNDENSEELEENSDIDEDISKILDEIEDNNEQIVSSKEESFEGDIMSDEFLELNSLNESDVLDALKGIDGANIVEEKKTESSKEEMVLNTSNVNELSELITKLLNNKTLEITVKIKD